MRRSRTRHRRAQSTPGPTGARHGRGGAGFRRALQGITLSDKQRQQIQQLTDQYRSAHPQGTPRDPQAMSQLRDSIMNVLTPQQQTQYKANVARMREHRGRRHEPSASPSPDSQT